MSYKTPHAVPTTSVNKRFTDCVKAVCSMLIYVQKLSEINKYLINLQSDNAAIQRLKTTCGTQCKYYFYIINTLKGGKGQP